MKSPINSDYTYLVSEILVFKTNIRTKKNVNTVGSILSAHFPIACCSIDTDDVDNVLRVVPAGDIYGNGIINLLRAHDFYIEALPD